jgi:hypothetical protein
MYFLYGELLALILGSFVVGCVLTGIAVRILVRRTEPAATDTARPDPHATFSGVIS